MRTTFAIALLACTAIAYACGNFDEADEPPADAGIDPTTSDAANEASADGAVEDGSNGGDDGGKDGSTALGVHAPPCPPPPGPTCTPISTCAKTALYVPADAGAEFPFGIVTDSKFVYWASMSFETAGDKPYDGKGTTRILRVDRSGGKAVELVTGQRNTSRLAIAGDHLYWAAQNGAATTLRRLHRGCAGNCPVDNLGAIGSTPIWGLVELDATTLVAIGSDGGIYHVKIGANVVSITLVGNAGTFPAVAAGMNEAFVSAGLSSEVKRVAYNGTLGVIGSIPDAGADSGTTIGMSPTTSTCSTLYGWRKVGSIWQLPSDGGTASHLANVPTSGIFSMASDNAFVYMGSADGPGVHVLDPVSKQSAQLATGNLQYIAVDDVGLYWGDHAQASGGALWMMSKK